MGKIYHFNSFFFFFIYQLVESFCRICYIVSCAVFFVKFRSVCVFILCLCVHKYCKSL